MQGSLWPRWYQCGETPLGPARICNWVRDGETWESMAETPEYLIEAVEAAVEPLHDGTLEGEPEVIARKSPVPFYGDAARAKVASVALNPMGADERLTDLESLGISSWKDVDRRHLERIAKSCLQYFQHQPSLNRPDPWRTWFGHHDKLLGKVVEGASFGAGTACHIDLVPWGTKSRWAGLSGSTKDTLLRAGAPTVRATVNGMAANLELLVLDGRAVVDGFQSLLDEPLIEEWAPELNLKSGRGRRWYGVVNEIGGVALTQPVRVLGWNWSLRSSRGASGKVDEFAEWARNKLKTVW